MENKAVTGNKCYTLTEDMINSFLKLKRMQVDEILGLRERYLNEHDGDLKAATKAYVRDFAYSETRIVAEEQLDQLLIWLSDENIRDLYTLMLIGKTGKVNMNLEPGKERFLDFYRNTPGIATHERYVMLYYIWQMIFFPQAVELGRTLLSLPKGMKYTIAEEDSAGLWDMRKSDVELGFMIAFLEELEALGITSL